MVGTQAIAFDSTKLATMPGTREGSFITILCHGSSLRPPAHGNDVRFRGLWTRARHCLFLAARSHVRSYFRSPCINRFANAIRESGTSLHASAFLVKVP